MMATIEQILREILVEDLDLSPAELRPEADLVADLGFDSLSFATGVAEIRERLGVTLSKDAVFSCRTLGDLQRLIAGQLAAA
ncbi:phosphopantetheine-binding protein [Nocardia sp. CDC159]|uniref:Phosphopantetheine-binding protein n=1 Tax=Nocardia pulmonis TaxID=2951408 RepID=A0A9X2IU62_9NOCA|nr:MULTISPECIES: phosphopantetheine-binding protein [Nocardia]MCM6772537.1 phosphopantetheine-binding protein [Nocardia pulmonis]MCM6784805.1 phosphopantetheine-binding protein [Nocardia sp. CDC159]